MGKRQDYPPEAWRQWGPFYHLHGGIWCKGAPLGGDVKLFDVRAWGFLTGKGHGALGLEFDPAAAIQTDMGDVVAAVLDYVFVGPERAEAIHAAIDVATEHAITEELRGYVLNAEKPDKIALEVTEAKVLLGVVDRLRAERDAAIKRAQEAEAREAALREAYS